MERVLYMKKLSFYAMFVWNLVQKPISILLYSSHVNHIVNHIRTFEAICKSEDFCKSESGGGFDLSKFHQKSKVQIGQHGICVVGHVQN